MSAGIPYLLDYTTGTFTRASEAAAVDPRDGWTFYDLVTPWKATNVPRILFDGAVLIEGARTNLIRDSNDPGTGLWTGSGGVTAGGADPSGGSDARRVQSLSGQTGRSQVAGDTTFAGTRYASSFYVRQSDSGQTVTQLAQGQSTVHCWSGPLPAEWARISIDRPADSSAEGIFVGDGRDFYAYPGGTTAGARDLRVWGSQLEAGTFPTSPIRTAGATATRATEASGVRFAFASMPSDFFTGRWAIDVWPLWSSAEFPGGQRYIYQTTANQGVAFIHIAGSLRLARLNSAGGIDGERIGVTFDRFQKMTLTTDEGAQTITLEGATTGNGTSSYPTALGGTHMTFGCHNGISAREANMVISRPRRA